jgi:hypothetical protein
MYQHPILTQVGKATEVILGVASWGDDMDGFIIVQDQEFAEDEDEDTICGHG